MFCMACENSLLWHPSGESSAFIVLADSHILMCDLEPSTRTAKVKHADSCESSCQMSLVRRDANGRLHTIS
jgi:hypothetical protein